MTGSGGDRIELRGLRQSILVGVLPEEQERPQPVELDLDLEVDVTAAAASDDLADAVDYGAVVAEVERVLAVRARAACSSGRPYSSPTRCSPSTRGSPRCGW